ncbi:MAG: hypothetical protein DMG32_06335 [Acidobacteria bacterium]|nr:MAG: hypothetical protein DMG32_06335 [Acidobacteriota bacterium]
MYRRELDPAMPVMGAIARVATTHAGVISRSVPREYGFFGFHEYFPMRCESLAPTDHIQLLTVNAGLGDASKPSPASKLSSQRASPSAAYEAFVDLHNPVPP